VRHLKRNYLSRARGTAREVRKQKLRRAYGRASCARKAKGQAHLNACPLRSISSPPLLFVRTTRAGRAERAASRRDACLQLLERRPSTTSPTVSDLFATPPPPPLRRPSRRGHWFAHGPHFTVELQRSDIPSFPRSKAPRRTRRRGAARASRKKRCPIPRKHALPKEVKGAACPSVAVFDFDAEGMVWGWRARPSESVPTKQL